MAYKVELDIYCGPLDLLLYLIHQEEVDIYDIPIARILERYIEHLEHVKHLDINLAAEFLLTASELMEIKSKMLLPAEDRQPDEEGEDDPRADLVRQLLAYRAFKEAAQRLGEYREARSRRYDRGRPVRLPEEPAKEPTFEELKEVSLFDLADSYAELVKATGGSRTATIVYDEVSIEARIDAIIAALKARDELALRALLSETASRVEVVGTFFALLELVKEGQVRVFQDREFGEITVRRRAESEKAGDEEGPEPAGPCVEPHLPPPKKTVLGADGRKRSTGPRRSHFGGLDLPEDRLEVEVAADGLEEAGETDEHERRLNRKIDDILRRADEISARFERSRAGRSTSSRPARPEPVEGRSGRGSTELAEVRRGSAGEAATPSRSRETVEAGASAGLAKAMAALEGDLAPEDEGGGGAPGGGASAGSDEAPPDGGDALR